MIKQCGLGMAAAMLLMGGSLVSAAEEDDVMFISATIVAGCSSIDAPDVLDMGSLAQGADGEAAGNIEVTCGNAVPYEVAIEGGTNDDAGSRRLNNFGGGADFIPYVIVSGACNSTTEVGTNNSTPAFNYTPTTAYPAGDVIPGTGDGTTQLVPVCAKVTAADTLSAPADVYEDQVRVVVAF
jgi:spore coat protein U-like protein